MTNLQKIQLRLSEVRSELNRLSGIESFSDDDKSLFESLQTEFRTLETRHQAAIMAADSETEADTGSPLARLTGLASVSDVFAAAVEHRSTAGATRELQQELGLQDNQIPLNILFPPVEERAATSAPANVSRTQGAILPAVFPMSAATFLGVPMPRVGVGDASYPVLTAGAEASTPAAGASVDESNGSFSSDVLKPSRIQASFFYSREDRSRFAGMDAALRMNLSDALMDKLDEQVLVGSNGFLTGTNLANHDAAGLATYANYIDQLGYGRVDGKFIPDIRGVKILMGSSTYSHASATYRAATAAGRAALTKLMDETSGVRVSSHVAAVASKKQLALVRLGMRHAAVCPQWEGISLIPDQITLAAKGQIKITAVMLYAFKILRTDDFYKQQLQIVA